MHGACDHTIGRLAWSVSLAFAPARPGSTRLQMRYDGGTFLSDKECMISGLSLRLLQFVPAGGRATHTNTGTYTPSRLDPAIMRQSS